MIFPGHRKPGTTLLERAIWGIGGAADNLLYNGLNSLIFPIFNIALGVNPLFLGIASAIPRFFDAISDPLVGNWSDNTRTRHGRRRPFILGGSLLAALFFFLLFLPGRTWSEPVILGYFTATLIFFYLSYALFVIPYTALGFELSHDPVERTKVLAWRMYVGLGAGFAIPFLYKACFFFGGDEVAGVKWVALAVGVFVAAIGLLLFFALHEQTPLSEKTLSLPAALAMTFKDRAFLFLAGTFLSVLFGIFVALPLVAYIDIYHIFGGRKSPGATFYGYFQLATTLGGVCRGAACSPPPDVSFFNGQASACDRAAVRALLVVDVLPGGTVDANSPGNFFRAVGERTLSSVHILSRRSLRSGGRRGRHAPAGSLCRVAGVLQKSRHQFVCPALGGGGFFRWNPRRGCSVAG